MCVYNDSKVHGNIELSELAAAIIETDVFKRLREIKQLGCASMYFPEAKHTRFEHCIGTYFLAGNMLNILEQNSNISIPKFYKDCVEIAGLLHDIGHGPFSHFWEHSAKELGFEYNHEENCKEAIDKIFCSIDISLDAADEKHKFGIELIKALILGDKKCLSKPIESEYEFLFEIIHNAQCNIDVDKWDYLLRDYKYCEKYLKDIELNMNFDKGFKSGRVSSDKLHIEFNRENYNEIYNLFDVRSKLHIHLYQNPEIGIREIFLSKAIKLYIKAGYTFEGLNLFEITSSKPQFISWTDNKLLETLKSVSNDEIKYYLSLLGGDILRRLEQENIIFEIKIDHAGEKMKEEDIPFYGNFKPDKITPKRGFYKQKFDLKFNKS